MVCSRAAMLLKVTAKSASSLHPVTGARAVKSPLPSLRAASLMASMGPVNRRANTMDSTLATSSASAADNRNILIMSPT